MLKRQCIAVLLAASASAQTQLTIYNQSFAVVKEQRLLNVQKGVSEIRLTDITAHLEPDSVILRDLQRPGSLQILEQNYESDPLSESLLLSKSEGKTLDFEITNPQTGEKRIVKGRVIRSGYVPHLEAFQTFGQQYAAGQQLIASAGGGQPIIEVDGRVQFSLPGQPVFTALDPSAFLKPTLLWRLIADSAGPHQTEFSYITQGMLWAATYNAVAAERGDSFDLSGWVTLQNASGKDFENTSIKLMAGDVARAQQQIGYATQMVVVDAASPQSNAVTEKPFDEYHLYALPHPTTLLDREIKQVEFLHAANVAGRRIYIYDGFAPEPNWFNNPNSNYQANFAGTATTKVRTELEFRNSEANHLGMPLPAGAMKLYRRDSDGRNEFIGESSIGHTPKDETTRIYLGNAFDLVGERTQTNFVSTNRNGEQNTDESFEIKVRNHKSEPVEVRVVERMYRGLTWEIPAHSMDFTKTNSRAIEFRPTVPANGEVVITYTVHYRW